MEQHQQLLATSSGTSLQDPPEARRVPYPSAQ